MGLKGSEICMLGLNVSAKNGRLISLEQIRAFLEATEDVQFQAAYRKQLCD
jgi:hypothetical protein